MSKRKRKTNKGTNTMSEKTEVRDQKSAETSTLKQDQPVKDESENPEPAEVEATKSKKEETTKANEKKKAEKPQKISLSAFKGSESFSWNIEARLNHLIAIGKIKSYNTLDEWEKILKNI